MIYVIAVGSEGETDRDIELIGPFKTRSAALAFCESPEVENWINAERDVHGADPRMLIVDQATDPDRWLDVMTWA